MFIYHQGGIQIMSSSCFLTIAAPPPHHAPFIAVIECGIMLAVRQSWHQGINLSDV
jgi:hypothetical protein